jgi:diguanylate cyclase (GGDEF)-like protein
MHEEEKKNINPGPELEELLAEGPRKDHVIDFYKGVGYQLYKEGGEERRKNEQLSESLVEIGKKADHDPLLGELLNREGFRSALAEIRKTGMSGALLMIDIDHFKKINDDHGHPVGNLALKAVARHLKAMCRPSDLIGREGGEEFVIFFPGATAEQILKQKLTPEGQENAVINIEFEPSDSNTPKIKITVSGGITDLNVDDDFEMALARTDATLYKIKKSGRNKVELVPEEFSKEKEIPQPSPEGEREGL